MGAWALTVVSLGCSTITEPSVVFEPLPNEVHHNQAYEAVVAARSPGAVSVPVRPEWLAFDSTASMLRGLPGWDNRGTHDVTLRLVREDGEVVEASYSIVVTTGPIDCTQDFGDPASSPYILPFPAGMSSRVTQSYCRTGPGGHHDTFAYDFSMAMGDTILAARSGLVYRVQESYVDGNGVPGRENFVYVEHDDDTVARYVHLLHQGALVDVGQYIPQGVVLGLNGLTGGTSRPHLHFEVFRDRTFNDSTVAFAKRFSLPVNFRNADGPLDARRGLIEGQSYTASPPG